MIPDSDSLLHHIKRVNCMTYIQKNYYLKDHPSPVAHGWHIENGLCMPTRSTLPALPRGLPELIEHPDDDADTDSDITSSDYDSDNSCGSDDYISDSETD